MGSTDAQHPAETTPVPHTGATATGPERAFQLETRRLIRSRLELATALFATFMGIVVVIERATSGSSGVLLAYGVELLICVAAVTANRTRRYEPATRTTALLCVCGLAVVMLAYSAVIGNAWAGRSAPATGRGAGRSRASSAACWSASPARSRWARRTSD